MIYPLFIPIKHNNNLHELYSLYKMSNQPIQSIANILKQDDTVNILDAMKSAEITPGNKIITPIPNKSSAPSAPSIPTDKSGPPAFSDINRKRYSSKEKVTQGVVKHVKGGDKVKRIGETETILKEGYEGKDISIKETKAPKKKIRSPTDKVIEISNVKEYDEFKKKYDRGIIFYGAKWCHACEEIEDLYQRIAARYHGSIALAHIDIDVAKLDFTIVPVFVSFRNGKQLDSMDGADKSSLKKLIREAIKAK